MFGFPSLFFEKKMIIFNSVVAMIGLLLVIWGVFKEERRSYDFMTGIARAAAILGGSLLILIGGINILISHSHATVIMTYLSERN